MSNSVRGKKAKTFGDLFEQLFERSCIMNGVTVTRIPDGCRQLGKGKIIRVPTPFDYILSFRGKSAFVDTKTTATTSFPHSKIDPHQVQSLLEHQLQGNPAGYVVWLRDHDEILFIPSSQLEKLSRVKGSIEVGQEKVYYLGQQNTFDPKALFSLKDNYFSM